MNFENSFTFFYINMGGHDAWEQQGARGGGLGPRGGGGERNDAEGPHGGRGSSSATCDSCRGRGAVCGGRRGARWAEGPRAAAVAVAGAVELPWRLGSRGVALGGRGRVQLANEQRVGVKGGHGRLRGSTRWPKQPWGRGVPRRAVGGGVACYTRPSPHVHMLH